MKCYCYETETEFIFCVEDADMKFEDNLQAAWWKKTDKKFIKAYPKEMDDGVDAKDKELVKRNFARLGQSMFEGVFDWEKVLLLLAQKFSDNGIEWYIIGSTSEAVLGVNIKPHDIDIIVHTRDFYKVKSIFPDYVVEPFVDNKGTWIVRYFGRICLDGAIVDIAADEGMNLERHQHQYDKVSWNGFDIFIEPLQVRYQTELNRNREERIMAIEEYMNCT
jgi:hypothetical protein